VQEVLFKNIIVPLLCFKIDPSTTLEGKRHAVIKKFHPKTPVPGRVGPIAADNEMTPTVPREFLSYRNHLVTFYEDDMSPFL
jgi:hypothetical protein